VGLLGLAFEIGGQNAADQSFRPGSVNVLFQRMGEIMIERQRAAGDALLHFRQQHVPLVAADDLALAHQHLAVHAEQVFLQGMALHAVEDVQLLAELVASGLGQIVAAEVKELRVHQADGAVQSRHFIRSLVLIYGKQRVVRGSRLVGGQGVADLFIVSEHGGVQQHVVVQVFPRLALDGDVVIDVKAGGLQELGHVLGLERVIVLLAVEGHADGLEQDRGEDLALAVDGDVHDAAQSGLLVIRHEFQPGAAARDQLAGIGVAAGAVFGDNVKIRSRGTHDLRYDDSLGAVDDEGSGRRHQREIAQEDVFPLRHDLAGLLIDDFELHLRLQRSAVVDLAVLALADAVFRLAELIVDELQVDVAAEVGDRVDILEYLADAFLHEPVKGCCLNLDQIGEIQLAADFGVVAADRFAAILHNAVRLFVFHLRHPFACTQITPKRA